MEPVFFDTCSTHPPGQFCRRLISSDYFLSYFDTPFRYETAGKLVDDEELREAMKENGIGRPATRAEIIKTLYKRNYVVLAKKNLVPTPMGIELIGLIREELLKSAELTGIWEKRLREIEARRYDPGQFINELKQMVADIVHQVLSDNTPRRI